jgi:hypothetical protein
MNTRVKQRELDLSKLENDGAPGSAGPPFDITVIIVSWNVAGVLGDCLDSLDRTKGNLKLEVLVVDNASSDDTLEMLRERFPWVRVVANRENCGFARGNNQGIALAGGRFVLLLNPDTIVSEGALQGLYDFLVTHSAAGAAGPNLRDANGNPDSGAARRAYTLAAALFIDGLHLRPVPLIGPFLYRRLLAPYDYAKDQRVEAICGAAIFARREILQSLGGFGEMFLHCGEDLDLCFRIRKAGWEIWYLVAPVVVHLGGESSKNARIRTVVEAVLSTEVYFQRCYGKWRARWFRCIVKTVQVPLMIAIGALKFVSGRGSAAEWHERVQVARSLMAWQRVK